MARLPRLALGAAALLALAGLPGCYSLNVYAADFYGDPQPGAEVVKPFSVELKAHHMLFGLMGGLHGPDVKAAIDREVQAAGGTRARNVKLVHQQELLDGLLGMVTLRLYQPSTVTLTGEVIK